MTYSFPCQDLSISGLGKGMTKGQSTRSGLLWEVERILDECLALNSNLPQCLLMENVPMIHSEKHVKDFKLWVQKLESLGYKNYIHDLNAKHYGIPQNRDRCFMVSILGNYSYEFPAYIKLEKCLGDLLEDEVEEKYYLSDKMIEGMLKTKFHQYQLENKLQNVDGISDCIISRFEGTPLLIKEATKKGYAIAQEGDGVYINRPHQKRGVVQKGICQTIKAQCDDIGVVVKDKINVVGNYSPSGHEASRIIDPNGISPTIKENHGTINAIIDEKLRIRKYTPKEVFRLMGFDDEDFEKASKVNSNAQLYKQAGNSIVVNVLEAIFKEMMEEK